jgi:hypothetical protein
MVDVGHVHGHTEGAGEALHDPEQGERIRAAGDRQQHALAAGEQLLPDEAQHPAAAPGRPLIISQHGRDRLG